MPQIIVLIRMQMLLLCRCPACGQGRGLALITCPVCCPHRPTPTPAPHVADVLGPRLRAAGGTCAVRTSTTSPTTTSPALRYSTRWDAAGPRTHTAQRSQHQQASCHCCHLQGLPPTLRRGQGLLLQALGVAAAATSAIPARQLSTTLRAVPQCSCHAHILCHRNGTRTPLQPPSVALAMPAPSTQHRANHGPRLRRAQGT